MANNSLRITMDPPIVSQTPSPARTASPPSACGSMTSYTYYNLERDSNDEDWEPADLTPEKIAALGDKDMGTPHGCRDCDMDKCIAWDWIDPIQYYVREIKAMKNVTRHEQLDYCLHHIQVRYFELQTAVNPPTSKTNLPRCLCSLVVRIFDEENPSYNN